MRHTIRNHLRRSGARAAAALFCCLAGCVAPDDSNKRFDLGIAPEASPLAGSAAYKDTIGSLGYFDGMAPLRVRGYGLVIGLGKNGSSDCPRRVYDKLVQSIYKQHHSISSRVGTREISPEKLIADLDTAVVIVSGDIPPAAVKGSRFDVTVTALPGTQTKSLAGGRLYTIDLEIFRELPSGISIVGQVYARASGPLFLNPFSDDQSATKANPLEGVIIDGGTAVKDRRLRFVLSQPSYRFARQVEDRINAQFTGPRKIADAVSPSFVQMTVPDEFHEEPGHFLELVRSLYVTRDPQFDATRARELAAEITSPTAPHGSISLCLEGLGRSAMPVLDELYKHPKDYVSFHAAVAGIRMGDNIACDRIALHAADVASPFRFQAIRALAEARGMATAALALRRLLDDSDPRIQIAAYEALVQRGDRTIVSRPVANDSFVLDRVPTASNKFVYAKRAGARRIAIFGDGVECVPPVLYRAPDGSVVINAGPQAEEVTILRTVVASGTTSPPISGPLDLPHLVELLGGEPGMSLDGAASGLGLDYGSVVRAIYHLCQDQAVNAKFMLEQPNLSDLFGPSRLEGRAESEL